MSEINSFDEDMEEWAEKMLFEWPDIMTDLNLRYNFLTNEFEMCIAYFSYFKWRIDIRPDIRESYRKYPPLTTVTITEEDANDRLK